MFKHHIDDDIHLSLLEMRHAETLHNVIANNRDHIGRFLSFAASQTLEETKEFVTSSVNKFAAGTVIPCLIWDQEVLIGSIGLNLSPNRNSASIGYWIAQDYRGRGIMTKCCAALIDYGFHELKLHRVEIRAIPDNVKSRAIPERLGFTQEGILRQDVTLYDAFADSVVYGLLADEWRI